MASLCMFEKVIPESLARIKVMLQLLLLFF